MRAFILLFILLLRNTWTMRVIEPVNEQTHNYCTVKEPTHQHTFDFSKLSNNTYDKKIPLDEHNSFRLQFCRPLVKPCNGKFGYSVCYNRSGSEVAIGKEPPQVDLSNGKIMFRYTGDPCNATHNYTFNVELKCNYMMRKEVAVDIDVTERLSENCDFNLGLETSAACTERNYTDCTIEESSGRYNLNPLTDFTKNYEVHINDDVAVILNICHSLLYGPHHINCSSESSICLIDRTDKSNVRYKNIGNFEEYPFIFVSDTRNLLINYDSNTLCNEKQVNSSQKLESSIKFICDLNATESVPEYVPGFNHCKYNFVWRTIAACSEQVLHDQSLINRDFCTVKDPLTQYEYDLSKFKRKSIRARAMDGIYMISVCRFLNYTVCKTGTGVCKLIDGNPKLSVSGGIANGKLMWKESGPYLNYTDGNVCVKGTKKYTIISFICFDTDRVEVEDTACHTYINWYTSAVCKRPCAMSLYDMNFERLIRWNSNYIVKANNTMYHINVCRPLVSGSQFRNCSDGAGICRIDVDNDGKSISEVNLGYPDQNLHGKFDGSVVLTYKNGALCEEDEEQRVSSQIKFICDLDHIEGAPRFVNYHNCTYYFEWKTKISCGTIPGELDDDKCQVTNVHGHLWDLAPVNKQDFYVFNMIKRDDNHTFSVSLCGGKKVCKDSYICDGKMSYGRNVTVTSDYRTNMLKFHFTNGSECKDGTKAQSILYIKCNESAIVGEPIVLSDQYCKPEFEWSIHSICKPQNLPSSKNVHPKNQTDSMPVFQIVCLTLLLMLVTCVTVWYFHKPSRRALCVIYINTLIRRYCQCCGEYPEPTNDLCL